MMIISKMGETKEMIARSYSKNYSPIEIIEISQLGS